MNTTTTGNTTSTVNSSQDIQTNDCREYIIRNSKHNNNNNNNRISIAPYGRNFRGAAFQGNSTSVYQYLACHHVNTQYYRYYQLQTLSPLNLHLCTQDKHVTFIQ